MFLVFRHSVSVELSLGIQQWWIAHCRAAVKKNRKMRLGNFIWVTPVFYVSPRKRAVGAHPALIMRKKPNPD